MTDTTESSTSQIGGANFKDISGETVEIKELHANTTAGGDITGRDKIIINYYYAERDSPPPAEIGQTTLDKTDHPSPYRGLYHFGPDDTNIFFGREVFTQRLV